MTATSATGGFEFPGSAAGRYTVEVLKPGLVRLRRVDVVAEGARRLPSDTA
jgi:hypothetical protein